MSGFLAQVVLDGIDITEFALEGSVTTRLSRIGEAQIKVHMTDAFQSFGTMYPGPGSYLKVYFYGDTLGSVPILWHHGRVLSCETTADENAGYTVFNSYDPLELWGHRPVRNPPGSDPGNFANPNIIQSNVFGPQIIEAMMDGSELNTIPQDSEGPLRLARGSFAAGSVDLTGAPSDWPMTMAELATLLVSTGVVDIVITPIEFDGSENYGQIDVYNGDYGTDRTGSVTFSYGMGARNIRALRWNEDMSNMCNKLWYYLGPKCDEEHWRANITGDDPGLTYPPGGRVVGPCGTGTSTNNQIGVRSCWSRDHFDVRMDIKIFDAAGDESEGCAESAVVGHELYRRLWQVEQYLRAVPLNLIHITPTRDTAIGDFSIGDLVAVEATADVKGGFSGAQRVYEYTISWDQDSVPAIGELQVSSDNEGL